MRIRMLSTSSLIASHGKLAHKEGSDRRYTSRKEIIKPLEPRKTNQYGMGYTVWKSRFILLSLQDDRNVIYL